MQGWHGVPAVCRVAWCGFLHMLTQQFWNGMHVLLQILIFYLNFTIWPGLAFRSHLDHAGYQLCRLADLAPNPCHHPPGISDQIEPFALRSQSFFVSCLAKRLCLCLQNQSAQVLHMLHIQGATNRVSVASHPQAPLLAASGQQGC